MPIESQDNHNLAKERDANTMVITSTILGILKPILDILKLMIGMIGKAINYFNRPKLEIYYDPNETYHKRTVISTNLLGNFAHVMVKNNGKSTAKNCVGELRSVEVLKNNQLQKVPGYVKIMSLKWAHERDFSPKDIEVDTPRRLDVCYVYQGLDILYFFIDKYPSGNQTDFPPDEYRIKIRIKSDNAESVEKEFIVKYYAGNFDSLEIKNI